jgi:two-component system, cell cycle response regulator
MPMEPPSSRAPGPRAPLPTVLEDDRTAKTMAPVLPPRDRGVLMQTGGLEAGKVYSLGDQVTLGRSTECTFVFDDAGLSRVHARVFRHGSAYSFEDAGSSNGSFLNDERTVRATLRDGDRLRLGSTRLRFQLVDELEENALRKVYESSVRDGLTGVFNRRHLDERMAAEIAYARRHATSLSVILFDVDHFKRINDTLGHLTGDEVLKHLVGVFREALRTEDLLARYGGEELVVVARGIEVGNAAQLAERLRRKVQVTPATVGDQKVTATVSAGVASLACCGAEQADAAALLSVADERLYRAKASGRNVVVFS